MFNLCASFIYVYNQDCVFLKKTEPKETVSIEALIRKLCCRAERTESSKGGISKTYMRKREGKGEGMEGKRKGEETIITSSDMEDRESVSSTVLRRKISGLSVRRRFRRCVCVGWEALFPLVAA